MDLTSCHYQVPLDDSSKDITTFIMQQGQFRFNVLPMVMKTFSDYFNSAKTMLEEKEKKDNIKIVDDVAGGSQTAEGIRKKVESVLDLCRKNKITLNPSKFKISRSIKVGVSKISSDDTYPNPQIKPKKMAINKVLDFPKPEFKKDI